MGVGELPKGLRYRHRRILERDVSGGLRLLLIDTYQRLQMWIAALTLSCAKNSKLLACWPL